MNERPPASSLYHYRARTSCHNATIGSKKTLELSLLKRTEMLNTLSHKPIMKTSVSFDFTSFICWPKSFINCLKWNLVIGVITHEIIFIGEN